MKTIRVLTPAGRYETAELPPGCYRILPNGRGRGTAYLADGTAYRVRLANPKRTFWTVTGEAR